MDACADFPLVVVTCRSHFFENDAAIPVRTGISNIVPRTAGRKSSYEFARLYLLPFDEGQIKQFLRKSFPFFALYSLALRRKASELIGAIPDLSARPMLLALVPELVKSGQEPKEVYELYEYMVGQWLQREEKWIEPEVLSKASTEIAFHISKTKQQTGVDRLTPEDVQALGLTTADLDWKYLKTRSLLNRDSEGKLKFAHRSIMEFLVVRGAVNGDTRAIDLVWTDFMREILLSYATIKPKDGRARILLTKLIQKREITQFPFSDEVPRPELRTKAEFETFANPSRRALISRHVFPPSWLESSAQVSRNGGQIFVSDLDHGLNWRMMDCWDNELDISLYKAGPQSKIEPSLDKYGLPSFPEVLTLLRLQLSNSKFKFVDPDQFYWLGDKSDSGSRTLFSLKQTISHPACTLLRSDVKIDGSNQRFNLYAYDPYRDHVSHPPVKALEAKVKRREIYDPEHLLV